MNWLDEVRFEIGALDVDAVEMSEAVMIKFGPVSLRLASSRVMTLEAIHWGRITLATRNQIELIEDRLAARGWVRA